MLVQVNEASAQFGKLDRFSAQEGSDALDSAVEVLRREVSHVLWELNKPEDGDTFAAKKQDVAGNIAEHDLGVDKDASAFNQVCTNT